MLAAEPRRELQEAVLAAIAPRPRPQPKRGASVRGGVLVWTAVGLPLTTAVIWAAAAVVGMVSG